jgi:hypothetical protein
MGTCPASSPYASAASRTALATRCFATVPIGTRLSVREETALHPLWRSERHLGFEDVSLWPTESAESLSGSLAEQGAGFGLGRSRWSGHYPRGRPRWVGPDPLRTATRG